MRAVAIFRRHVTASVALLLCAGVLSGCTLPRTGPNKSEIFSGSVQKQGDAFIVEVNEHVTRTTAVVPALGFTSAFRNAQLQGSDTIRPGDTLGLSIWENTDNSLLAGQATNSTRLDGVQVDESGYIFVPYAGRIKAAGNSPDSIRKIITDRLKDQTPDPQVQVQRAAGDGSTVSIIGAVGGQGIYVIERPTRTLSAMLAKAGGVAIEPEVAQITIMRGPRREKVWFQDLYDHPNMDIALRGGDRILVETDTRAFTSLGATGSQGRVAFPTQTISAVEALALVGGLSATTADPTGIFVFRNEVEEIANLVMGRDDLQGTQKMIYVLDLTKPNGIFTAREFVIRDQDTVYVTEAPFTQWNKAIAAATGSLGAVNTLDQSAQTLAGN